MRATTAFLIGLLASAAPAAAPQPAHDLFGAHRTPSSTDPAAFGGYARGCLAGGVELRETAGGWQAMRLSRNRNWGHPKMIAFLERLSSAAREVGWPRLYIGDIGQPRGGPMKSGHRSHQIGLDVDVWMRRPADRPLDRDERERIGSVNVVAENGVDLNSNWTPEHHEILRAAARDPAVARIFVHPAIKRGLCIAEGRRHGRIDAPWLRKIRPWHGHNYHFHVRLACPGGSPGCRDQHPPPPGDGCGAELSTWFPEGTLAPADAIGKKSEEAPEAARGRTRGASRGAALTLSDLPPQCGAVLADDAEALASIAPYAPQATAQPPAPVFFDERLEAHHGFLGTPFFWTPPVDRNAAERRGVALSIDGALPPGLEFRDRGAGHGLVRGVPEAEGTWGFDVVARDGDTEAGRLAVTLVVEKLRAETAEAAELPSLEHQVRDFVVNFTGAECFLATPVRVAAARIDVEAFSDEAQPFFDFDAAFKTAIGREAHIGGRMVAPGQCEALAFARAFPHGDPPQIRLSDPDATLTPGQPLEATITGPSVRYITLLMVRPDGSIADLSDYLTRRGEILELAVVVAGRGPHLLVAVDTAFPLVKPDYMTADGANDILATLRSGDTARNYDMRVALGYFLLQ